MRLDRLAAGVADVGAHPSNGGFRSAAGRAGTRRLTTASVSGFSAETPPVLRPGRPQGGARDLRWAGRESTRRPYASHTAPHPARAVRAARTGGLRRWPAGSSHGSRRRRLHAWSELGHRARRPCLPGRRPRQPAPRRAWSRRPRRIGHADGGGDVEGAAHGLLRLPRPRRPGPAGRSFRRKPLGGVRLHDGRLGREHRLWTAIRVRRHAGLARLARSQGEHRALVLPGDRGGCRSRCERNPLLGAGVRHGGRQWLSTASTSGSAADARGCAQAGRSRTKAAGPGRPTCAGETGEHTGARGSRRSRQAFPCLRGAANPVPGGEQASRVGSAPAGGAQIHRSAHDYRAQHRPTGSHGSGDMQGARSRTSGLGGRSPLRERLRRLQLVGPARRQEPPADRNHPGVSRGQADSTLVLARRSLAHRG
jgi:hypothetical protein